MAIRVHQGQIRGLMFAPFTFWLAMMYLPGLIGLDGPLTYGTLSTLCIPGLSQPGTVAKMLTNVFLLPLVKVYLEFRIEESGCMPDFDVPNNGHFVNLETAMYFPVFVSGFEYPFVGSSVPIDLGEVAVNDPFPSLLRMASFGPSPYLPEDVVADTVKDLATYRMAVVVGPTS
jgi:hypothetical protein